MSSVKLIECPRDAMQGWHAIIPAEQKITYLNSLLKVGFDTLDAGSFVSAKAIPQMADTAEVFERLDLGKTHTKLLAIIANVRGAEEAVKFPQVSYLGFPFSISDTFQQRNTNSSIDESFIRLQVIRDICMKHAKELVVYISMGFGNPYGDSWSPALVADWTGKITGLGVNIISLADTVGLATAAQVSEVTASAISAMPGTEIGVHLHSAPHNWQEKFDAAWNAGCRRFDGALMGIGGCPMAGDALVGNMNMENMIAYLENMETESGIDQAALDRSLELAGAIFI